MVKKPLRGFFGTPYLFCQNHHHTKLKGQKSYIYFLKKGLMSQILDNLLWPGLRIRIRSDPVFLHGSRSSFQISLDPDPVSAQMEQ